MILLTSTSDVLQIVTGSAVTVDVHASYVDNNAGAITPGRANTEISTATTTTVVASPGSGIQRNVRSLYVRNTHGTDGTTVTVRHSDGTTAADLLSVSLRARESLVLENTGNWTHFDANGGAYSPSPPPDSLYALGVSGTISETIPRMLCSEANLSALTSGTLYMVAIFLQAGQKVSSISFCSATTAAGTPTNQFFALYDKDRVKLAESANDTTTAWAANTMKTLSMETPYTATYTGLYYVALLVVATTVPTMKGNAAKTASQLQGQAPILHGTSNTGLTTSVPGTANAITATVNSLWARVL